MTWEMHFTFVDDENHSSIVTINFDDSIVTANLASAATAFLAVIAPLTDAGFVKATVTRTLISAAGTIVAGADVEIGANFIWAQLGKAKRTIQRIPAFVRSKLVENSKVVDETDADVIAFVDAMTDGLTAVSLFAPTSDEGTDLTALVIGQETYSKARK